MWNLRITLNYSLIYRVSHFTFILVLECEQHSFKTPLLESLKCISVHYKCESYFQFNETHINFKFQPINERILKIEYWRLEVCIASTPLILKCVNVCFQTQLCGYPRISTCLPHLLVSGGCRCRTINAFPSDPNNSSSVFKLALAVCVQSYFSTQSYSYLFGENPKTFEPTLNSVCSSKETKHNQFSGLLLLNGLLGEQ